MKWRIWRAGYRADRVEKRSLQAYRKSARQAPYAGKGTAGTDQCKEEDPTANRRDPTVRDRVFAGPEHGETCKATRSTKAAEHNGISGLLSQDEAVLSRRLVTT